MRSEPRGGASEKCFIMEHRSGFGIFSLQYRTNIFRIKFYQDILISAGPSGRIRPDPKIDLLFCYRFMYNLLLGATRWLSLFSPKRFCPERREGKRNPYKMNHNEKEERKWRKEQAF
jgi:hypothetical protein